VGILREKDEPMVDLSKGASGIVRDILAEAGRPMTVQEIAVELDRLGYQHARPSTYLAASGAIMKRRRHHTDIVRVAKATYQFDANGK
jgi:hypothetical protein